MILRSYQQDAVSATLAAFEKYQSVLVVMATGLGKTLVMGQVIHERPQGRFLVIAHREELIRQAQEKILAVTGERPEIEMAAERADEGGLANRSRGIVASVQTLINRASRFDPKEFTTIVTDEAHRSVAASYRKVYKHFLSNPLCKHLGVTATPDRGDEEALGQIFEKDSYRYDLLAAKEDGWLVNPVIATKKLQGLDLTAVKTTDGDFNQGQLASAVERVLFGVSDHLVSLSPKLTLVFVVSVDNARQLANMLNVKQPGSARWVCGTTPKEDRQQILADFVDGKFLFLVNVGILTEGYDNPRVERIALVRPTKVRSLVEQIVGRGTRPLPGLVDGLASAAERRAAIEASSKPRLEVIDFTGVCGKHKLVGPLDILGGKASEAVIERARKIIERSDELRDPAETLKQAREELRRERDAAHAAEVARLQAMDWKARYETEIIDPFDVLDLKPPTLVGKMDNVRKPSHKMVSMLASHGIRAESMKFAQAGALIQEMRERREKGLCSFAIAKALKRIGQPSDVSPQEAARLLQEAAMKQQGGVS